MGGLLIAALPWDVSAIAMWDGRSSGTRGAIEVLKGHGVAVEVISP